MTIAAFLRSLVAFVLGSKDYEPERPDGNAPGTTEHRRKRHEQIRRRREQDGRALLTDPHKGEEIIEKTRLVIVSPGRRVGWEPVLLPGGYILDDLELEVGGRSRAPNSARWNAQLRDAIREANFRQQAKVRRYELQVEQRKAEQLDAAMERKFARAVAREAREAKRG